MITVLDYPIAKLLCLSLTVGLWDAAALAGSASLAVAIGGRRLFRLSSSGEGEVSSSCAVGLKCTNKTEKNPIGFLCLVAHEHTVLSVCHYVKT